jgi:hypothetical protein
MTALVKYVEKSTGQSAATRSTPATTAVRAQRQSRAPFTALSRRSLPA